MWIEIHDAWNAEGFAEMYLIRYSEIALKSPPVRRRWEDVLVSNLQKAQPECKVRKSRGRIWLEGNVDPERLKKVFGIVSFSRCEHCYLQDLSSSILKYCDATGLEKAKSFALRLRRVGNHAFTSQEKTIELADMILEKFRHLNVDLDNPNATVYVEIRDNDCYLYRNVIKGSGGLPLGVEGKLVALFSGGIDSPVAAWMMMKRGCKVIPIYVELDSFSSESALKRAMAVIEALKAYQPDLELRVVKDDFLKRAKEIMKKEGLENYTCLICKRRMYCLAESMAEEVGAKGIVTGESLGQVASQTLDNLLVLDNAISMPIYRPLIGFDKIEAEKIAREIGTLETSIMPAVGCTAVPYKPATKAKLEKVLKIEEELAKTQRYELL
ncbi:MAG: tRNA 4-thiouridine(8) synthase ThiI [Methanotrichaceae archaeon]|nr:tRNA 4-thiouridine(8) synthase ThiI [Methanotrichaceae archaeon]